LDSLRLEINHSEQTDTVLFRLGGKSRGLHQEDIKIQNPLLKNEYYYGNQMHTMVYLNQKLPYVALEGLAT